MSTECTSTIIIGGGRVGSDLASRLDEAGGSITVIEQDGSGLPDNDRTVGQLVQGNALNRSVLETADISEADVVVAATGDDQTNLLTCEIAIKDYGVPVVLSRCNHPDYLDSFKELGIQVVSPPVACSERIYDRLNESTDQDSIESTVEGAVEAGRTPVETQIEIENPDVVNNEIRQLDVPSEIAVLAVHRDGASVQQPSDDIELQTGDVLEIYGPEYAIADLRDRV